MSDAPTRSGIPFTLIRPGCFTTARMISMEMKVRANLKNESVIGDPYEAITLAAVQLKPQHVMLRIMPVKNRFLLLGFSCTEFSWGKLSIFRDGPCRESD